MAEGGRCRTGNVVALSRSIGIVVSCLVLLSMSVAQAAGRPMVPQPDCLRIVEERIARALLPAVERSGMPGRPGDALEPLRAAFERCARRLALGGRWGREQQVGQALLTALAQRRFWSETKLAELIKLRGHLSPVGSRQLGDPPAALLETALVLRAIEGFSALAGLSARGDGGERRALRSASLGVVMYCLFGDKRAPGHDVRRVLSRAIKANHPALYRRISGRNGLPSALRLTHAIEQLMRQRFVEIGRRYPQSALRGLFQAIGGKQR